MGAQLAGFDSIIIGAGHNGLVCAAYLARAGQKVLVLEAADQPGGLAANREFHSGFRVPIAHTLSHFAAEVAKDLDLASRGFSLDTTPLKTIGLDENGQHIFVGDGTVTGVSAEDNGAYQNYCKLMNKFADALAPSWFETMPRIGNNNFRELMTFGKLGLKLRRLGKKDMQEFLRIATLPARDLMDENFDNEVLKATLAWEGLVGAKLAPRSPNSAVLSMLYRMTGESRGAHSIPASGIAGLIQALRKSAETAGAEIRCSTEVDRILIEGGESGLVTRGIRTAAGESINSDRVISATDPQRTFINLVGVENLDIGFTNRIRRLRCDGYVGKLHLALDGKPEFSGLADCQDRMLVAPSMDHIEFAFDGAKYGELPKRPVMEIVVPSQHDASLAPDGQHVLSAHVMYVPRNLKGGWTDDARALICARSIDAIAKYAPGISTQIIGCEFLTPADLESDYRVSGGHWHHTEMAVDQMLMMRPTYEAAQYSTPVPGLMLCSAGCHPGGDITGISGHNAAREILR